MKIWKSSWTYVIIALLLIGILFGYKNITENVVKSSQYDEFAKYLTEQGIKMYGTEWCPHCKNQKKLFGSSFQYIDYVDCDKDRQECLSAGVQGYPTWKINENNYPGEQSLERLAQLSRYTDNAPVKEFTMTSFTEVIDGKYYPQYSLKEITINKGDLVRIKITVTKGMHDFKIDEFNVYVDTKELNKEYVVEFTADKVGEFIYYCTKPGHRQAGHWGTLKVVG